MQLCAEPSFFWSWGQSSWSPCSLKVKGTGSYSRWRSCDILTWVFFKPHLVIDIFPEDCPHLWLSHCSKPRQNIQKGNSRQTQAGFRAMKKKVKKSLLVSWQSGPRNTEARFDLNGVVTGYWVSKDVPIWHSSEGWGRGRKSKAWMFSSPRDSGRIGLSGHKLFSKFSLKNRGQVLWAEERHSHLVPGLWEKPEGEEMTLERGCTFRGMARGRQPRQTPNCQYWMEGFIVKDKQASDVTSHLRCVKVVF